MQQLEPTILAQIDRLNEQAWLVRVSDSQQSMTLSGEALSFAEQAGYDKGKAEALRTHGFCHIRLSRHQEALEFLNPALALFQKTGHRNGESDVYEYFGIIKRSLGDYGASLESLFRALEIRQQTGYRDGESLSYYHIGITYKYLGYLEQALEHLLNSLRIAREINYWVAESYSLNNIGVIYADMGDFHNALEYYGQSLQIRRNSGDKWGEAGCLDNIGLIYSKLGDPEKGAWHCLESLEITQVTGDKKGQGNSLFHLGTICAERNDPARALDYTNRSLQIRTEIGDKRGQAEAQIFLSEMLSQSEPEKTEALLSDAFRIGQELQAKDLLAQIHRQQYLFCKASGQHEAALSHLETQHELEKELFNQAFNLKLVNLKITWQVEQSRKEAELLRAKNTELAALNVEIQAHRQSLEETLEHLKSTQNQLIQREKMASLGELTAGIAHEIQNPLNFVNNFSELSMELAGELNEEMQKPDFDPQIVAELLNDLTQNQEKINVHGKRASGIVKGMLEHSRTNAGQKTPTDINALTEEHLRLSYHGLRAKDQSFNATFETNLDESLEPISVVPQDLGRVLLNLFNNAFQAVREKSKKGVEGYRPIVSVTTKKTRSGIEIRVGDNGGGIPEAIRQKIFQPFFTTKPPGEGTGLGLSLSYEIVTKGYGGTLEVESREGEGTEFVLHL